MGDVALKRFRQPATNQEIVLSAFQDDGWPPRIDDPLPGKAGQDSKGRLHDTIKRLNSAQHPWLIRYYGDGTGYGVCWELRD